ncbi:hypothetical protein [Halalkalicoccus salilacus]
MADRESLTKFDERIVENLEADMEAFDAHGDLAEEVRSIVREGGEEK